jgi:Zn-dependent protease with chaperone function
MVKHTLNRRLFLAGSAAGGLLATKTASAITISIGGDGGGLLSTKNLRAMINMLKGLEFSTEDEIALGEQLFPRLVAGSGGPYKNPNVQKAVAEIATPIIATSERDPLPWQVVVVADSTINAWALPGGKLAVNIGLLRYAENEDELAAVIAHEKGHVESRHAIAQSKKKSFVEGISAIGQSALNSELRNHGAAGYAAGSLAGELDGPMLRLVSSGYEKSAEFEADQQIPKSFARAGPSVERGLGSGLGLSMVVGFAEQAGGLAGIESELGVGTSAYIYLPLVDQPAVSDDAMPPLTLSAGNGETVLIVEDNPEVLTFMSNSLRQRNYHVIKATDMNSAMDKLADQPEIDVLLTDVALPENKRGADVAAWILRQRPRTKVIYTSGYTRAIVEDDGRLPKGANFLQKPFTVSELERAIRRALDS